MKLKIPVKLLWGLGLVPLGFGALMLLSSSPDTREFNIPDEFVEAYEQSATSSEEGPSVNACGTEIPSYGDLSEGVNALLLDFVLQAADSQAKARAIHSKMRWTGLNDNSNAKKSIRALADNANLNANLGHGVLLSDINKDIEELRKLLDPQGKGITPNNSQNVAAIVDKLLAIRSNLNAIEGNFGENQTVNGFVMTQEILTAMALLEQDAAIIQTIGLECAADNDTGSVYVNSRDGKTEE